MDRRIFDGTRPKRAPTATITSEYQEIPASSIKFDKEKNGGKIQLGDGGFGVVYKGRYGGESGAAIVAIKRIKKSEYGIKSRDVAELKREAKLMYRVRHPDIVTVYGLVCDNSLEEDQLFAIVLEYMEYGSMEEFMEKYPVPWPIKVKMLEEVSRGLLFLCTPQSDRNYQIVHGDLKAANILIDRSFKAKLADFGTCRLQTITSKSTKRAFQATLTHIAPELLDIPMDESGVFNSSPTEESDVWSFGITLFEACAEIRPGKEYGIRDRVPFAAEVQDFQIPGMIRRNMDITKLFNPHQKKKIPQDCPSYLWDLILQCCVVQANKRPKFKEIHKTLEEKFQKECESSQHPAMAELHTIIQTAHFGPSQEQQRKLEEYKKNQQANETEIEQKQAYEQRKNEREIIQHCKQKIEFLCIHGFLQTVKACQVEAAVDMNNALTFFGERDRINEAKVHMYELLNQMHIEKAQLPQVMCMLLNVSDVQKALPSSNILNGKKVFWEVSEDHITIYGKSEEDTRSCLEILKRDVVVKTIEVPQKSRKVFKTERWESIHQQISSHFEGRVKLMDETDFSVIQVCALQNKVDTVVEMVESLLKSGMPSKQIFKLQKSVVEFLKQNSVSEIQEQNSVFSVEIIPILEEGNAGFEITGIGDGVANAVTALQELSEKIVRIEHDVHYPGMQKYFSSQPGSYMISGLENQNRVYIQVHCKNIIQTPSQTQQKEEFRVISKFVAPQGGTIYIVQGDITSYSGGAIVCSATEDLKIIGQLAKTICEKGGMDIEKECIQHVRLDGNLLPGNVFPSRAGKMKCSHIIHAVGPEWKGQGEYKEFQQELSEAVHQALHQAEFLKLETVAFPIISSGSSKCPKEICCNIMACTVKDFFETEALVSVKIVHLVDESSQNTSLFHRALQEIFGNAEEKTVNEDDKTSTLSYFNSQNSLNDSGITPDIAAKQSSSLQSDTDVNGSFLRSLSTASVAFHIYGLTQDSCDEAVFEIDKICKNESIDKVLKTESDQRFIKKLSDAQVHKIKSMEVEYQVKITVERGKKVNRIRIRGLHKDVSDAIDKIHQIFHEIQNLEKEALMNELLSKMVEWQYDCGSHFQTFTCDQNALIEKQYASRKDFAEYSTEEDGRPKTIRILFDKMVKIELEDPDTEVPVKRYTLETVVDRENRYRGAYEKHQTTCDSTKTAKHVHFTETGSTPVSRLSSTEYPDERNKRILFTQIEAEKQAKRFDKSGSPSKTNRENKEEVERMESLFTKMEMTSTAETAERRAKELEEAEARLKMLRQEEDRLYAMKLAEIEAGEIPLECIDNYILDENYKALGEDVSIEGEYITPDQKCYYVKSTKQDWYGHFDGEDIAREIMLRPSHKPVLFLAGVDNEKMCQEKLSECSLSRNRSFEIHYQKFEEIWTKHGGNRYFQKYKNIATSQALLKQHTLKEMKTDKIYTPNLIHHPTS